MKFILFLLLFSINSVFGQRWITSKSSGYYVADSTGVTITGTANQVRNWAETHMDIEDTSSFQIQTVAPTINSKIETYRPDDMELDELPSIPVTTTSRIPKLQAKIPVGTKRVYLIWDRTLNKLALFNRNNIVYLIPTP